MPKATRRKISNEEKLQKKNTWYRNKLDRIITDMANNPVCQVSCPTLPCLGVGCKECVSEYYKIPLNKKGKVK